MSIARWDPFLELKTLDDRMSRWFGRPFRAAEGGLLSTSEFAPPADVYEDDNKLILKMEVPGIKQEDLDIRVDGNTLTIAGERKFEKEEKRENFRRVERQYGSFCRSFELSASADRDNITASFEDGILRIQVPKRAEARGKQIQIGGSAATTKAAKEGRRAA